MIGNITLDDFYKICDEFNLEFNALDDYYIMHSKKHKVKGNIWLYCCIQ